VNPPPQRGQTAARETLAQAQALWNAGSREAALDLVREAVGVLERIQPVDVASLTQLVREQVRMELALGRPGAVLALLSRLEPLLSGQADLWAVRGNAAQRLGRHEESVQAYLAALQLRPGEARWMLGAAVSLAALGKTEAAAQQAEQARALGPISPEVLTYLRQAGVPLP
jgi:tetratricopeptide (TPR) repeat protein